MHIRVQRVFLSCYRAEAKDTECRPLSMTPCRGQVSRMKLQSANATHFFPACCIAHFMRRNHMMAEDRLHAPFCVFYFIRFRIEC